MTAYPVYIPADPLLQCIDYIVWGQSNGLDLGLCACWEMSSKLFSASDFATAVLWPIVSAMLVAEQLPTKVDRPNSPPMGIDPGPDHLALTLQVLLCSST